MADVIHRLFAYSSAPDVYYAPTPDECRQAALEIQRLRAKLAYILDADEPEPLDEETIAARKHAHDDALRQAGRGHLVRP